MDPNVLLALFCGGGSVVFTAFARFVWRIWKAVERVEAQVHTNGGSTMRDAVNRIEARQLEIRKDVRRQGRRITKLEERP